MPAELTCKYIIIAWRRRNQVCRPSYYLDTAIPLLIAAVCNQTGIIGINPVVFCTIDTVVEGIVVVHLTSMTMP